MKITSTDLTVDQVNADAIVVGVWKGESLTGAAQDLDRVTDGGLTKLIESEEVSAAANSVTVLLNLAGIQAPVVAVVGLGEKSKAESSSSFRAAASAAKQLAAKKRKSVAFYLQPDSLPDAICGAIVGCQGQDIFRNEASLFPFEEIVWNGAGEADIEQGRILGESVNWTRRMVNEPANYIYPTSFADRCTTFASDLNLEIEVWDQSRLEKEKCGSLLAVSRGSEQEPRIVIIRYRGGDENAKPIGLVGKGVTFDSGGLSLKPSEFMMDMKCDMAGAATVMGAIQAIARLKLPVNVNAYVGLVENMISGKAYKLGDVLTARSGKTIEVHNTDAEGRLVLADVLDVAVNEECTHLIDLATLTGACVVALGLHTAGAMTNHDDWCQTVLNASKTCGEALWPLPMYEEFGKQIKSKVADIKNVGEGRWGGAITAAKFLEEFVKDVPWVHIDIAGPSFGDKPQAWIDAGATGCMVRTLVEVVRGV